MRWGDYKFFDSIIPVICWIDKNEMNKNNANIEFNKKSHNFIGYVEQKPLMLKI